jgi:hypothetical protein
MHVHEHEGHEYDMAMFGQSNENEGDDFLDEDALEQQDNKFEIATIEKNIKVTIKRAIKSNAIKVTDNLSLNGNSGNSGNSDLSTAAIYCEGEVSCWMGGSNNVCVIVATANQTELLSSKATAASAMNEIIQAEAHIALEDLLAVRGSGNGHGVGHGVGHSSEIMLQDPQGPLLKSFMMAVLQLVELEVDGEETNVVLNLAEKKDHALHDDNYYLHRTNSTDARHEPGEPLNTITLESALVPLIIFNDPTRVTADSNGNNNSTNNNNNSSNNNNTVGDPALSEDVLDLLERSVKVVEKISALVVVTLLEDDDQVLYVNKQIPIY